MVLQRVQARVAGEELTAQYRRAAARPSARAPSSNPSIDRSRLRSRRSPRRCELDDYEAMLELEPSRQIEVGRAERLDRVARSGSGVGGPRGPRTTGALPPDAACPSTASVPEPLKSASRSASSGSSIPRAAADLPRRRRPHVELHPAARRFAPARCRAPCSDRSRRRPAPPAPGRRTPRPGARACAPSGVQTLAASAREATRSPAASTQPAVVSAEADLARPARLRPSALAAGPADTGRLLRSAMSGWVKKAACGVAGGGRQGRGLRAEPDAAVRTPDRRSARTCGIQSQRLPAPANSGKPMLAREDGLTSAIGGASWPTSSAARGPGQLGERAAEPEQGKGAAAGATAAARRRSPRRARR